MLGEIYRGIQMNYTTFDEVLHQYNTRARFIGTDKVALNSDEVKTIIPTLNNLIQIELKKNKREDELLAKLKHDDMTFLIKARIDYFMNDNFRVYIEYIVR